MLKHGTLVLTPVAKKTVNWIADYLCEKWNCKIPQVDQKRNAILHAKDADQLYEAKYLKLDCSKAKSKLGWQPVWSLEQALDRIAEWYQSFIAGDDMREISISQVSEYTEMRSIF